MTPTRTILVFNAGSSSLKYLLTGGADVTSGVVSHVGEPSGPPDHAAALEVALDALSDQLRETPPAAIGHRVVHGGADMRAPVVIDDKVEAVIEAMAVYAPLHNPPALKLIRAAQQKFPGVPQVAVFDTAFHSTMPEAARTYALDLEVAQQNGIRRFGFHGISVAHSVRAVSALLGRASDHLNMIVLHLGNGASATAVERGRSVDTSMGLTPLEGLVMGDRAGDMDPAITFHLARAGWKLDDIGSMYENDAGLRGLCGDNDMRRILSRADSGDRDAELALAVYCHRLRKYIGAYLAVLGHADAIVFTGGVGENAVAIRARALAGLDPLGIVLDRSANAAGGGGARIISEPASRTAVCVVPAAEEEAIAHETARLLGLGG